MTGIFIFTDFSKFTENWQQVIGTFPKKKTEYATRTNPTNNVFKKMQQFIQLINSYLTMKSCHRPTHCTLNYMYIVQ